MSYISKSTANTHLAAHQKIGTGKEKSLSDKRLQLFGKSRGTVPLQTGWIYRGAPAGGNGGDVLRLPRPLTQVQHLHVRL